MKHATTFHWVNREGISLEVTFKLDSESQKIDQKKKVKIWGKNVPGRVRSWSRVSKRLGISEEQNENGVKDKVQRAGDREADRDRSFKSL